jgi:hypothetical protein
MASIERRDKGLGGPLPSHNVEAYFSKAGSLSSRIKRLLKLNALSGQARHPYVAESQEETAISPAFNMSMLNTKVGLCNFCRTLDFAKIFISSPENPLDSVCCHLERFITWDLSVARRNGGCSFCRLLLRALPPETAAGSSPSRADCKFIMGHVEGFEMAYFSDSKQSDASAGRRRLWITASQRHEDSYNRNSAPHNRKECWDVRRAYDRCIALPCPRYSWGNIDTKLLTA